MGKGGKGGEKEGGAVDDLHAACVRAQRFLYGQ